MASLQHLLTPEELALRIQRHKPIIQLKWLNMCKDTIPAAKQESFTYLNDHLPVVLDRLVEVLAAYDSNQDFYEAMVLAKRHGEQRALNGQYTVKDLLTEYEFLRAILIETASVQGMVGIRTANIVGNFIEASLAHSIDEFMRFTLKEPYTQKPDPTLADKSIPAPTGPHH